LFRRFKEGSHPHNIKLQGEAAARSPEDLAEIIHEGGSTTQRIFSVDQTAFYQKMMPSRTFTAREGRSGPGYKASKDGLTLPLGANADADFKLKPVLVYHSENPRDPKNYAKSTLPVLYQWNNKARTGHIFTTWYKYFKLTVEAYCSEDSCQDITAH